MACLIAVRQLICIIKKWNYFIEIAKNSTLHMLLSYGPRGDQLVGTAYWVDERKFSDWSLTG